MSRVGVGYTDHKVLHLPVSYYIDKDADLLIGLVSGAITYQEINSGFSRIVEQTKGQALFKNHIIVFDERTETHNLSIEALVHIKDNIESLGQIYPGRDVKTAMVVSDPVRSAIAKVWQALTDAYPSIGARVRLFRDLAEAKAWLETQD